MHLHYGILFKQLLSVSILGPKPAVVALKEANSLVELPGYVPYSSIDTFPTLTLAHKTMSVIHSSRHPTTGVQSRSR